MERKLAAILAADVVGYSALMEADEAGTHERLKAGRKELFEPEIARHHGRVFKIMGDGLLAEFDSVVNAVECAVALQRGLAERNATFPLTQQIQVRIGINLGEVIVEGDDRYGEGVNIATRIEQLADPGGICVSGKVAQLNAQLLTREHKSDEAIAGLQAAVSLDPSNHWTFEVLSQTLIFNGRPKEGRAYLDTAMRLDPTGSSGWNDWRNYLAGLAAFGDDRFEDAVQSLEKIDLEAPYPWPKFYGLQVLLSAYGHLGRSEKLEPIHARLQAVLNEMGQLDYDRLHVQHFFVFKNEADIARLLDGLSKAGLPEMVPEADSEPTDRLTAAEMKSLVFGHELRGRRTDEPAEYRRSTAINGSATVVIGSETRHGMSWTQAGYLCIAYPRDLTSCGVIYRNPGGSREQSNEYRFIFNDARYEFSVVK